MLQTANNSTVKKPVIFQCVKKVQLFENTEKCKNRRFTKDEFVTELEISKWLHRPPRTYVKDPPFYPWLPPEPLVNQPIVNFDLNYQ